MGLLGFGKKKNTIISTKLNGSSAKGRQESLRNLQQYHDEDCEETGAGRR